MKRIVANPFCLVTVLLLLHACSDFLDIEPQGRVNESSLATKEGVESLLIGAYAMLDGISNGFEIPGAASLNSAASNWVYGSIAGTDAHKGSYPADVTPISFIEQYDSRPTNDMFNDRWRAIYEGVARANSVLIVLAQLTDPDNDTIRVRAEARVLRGIYHFEALKLWGKVPYINEYVDPDVAKNDTEIWPQVVADLKSGYDKLPEKMNAVGRINKWVAAAFYAKALLFQRKYSEAYPVLNEIYVNGTNPLGLKFALMPSFSDNFNVETENNSESVFAFQYSVNDGSNGINGAFGEFLNFPWDKGPVGCCGFFQPSSELVNSYRTDNNGLPMLNGAYNDPGNVVIDDDGKESNDNSFVEDAGNLDPRLDWTVGRRGIPYHDWGVHPGEDWIREQAYGGPYSPKKNMYRKSQKEQYVDQSWPGGPFNANNYVVIRFADIILWLAECEVEVGSLDKAREYVNMIRARAANPGGFVKEENGTTPAANYVVGLYAAGFPFDNKANARKAVHFERKLELAMEGHRFFDLVRWGEAASSIEAYLNYEKTKRAESLNEAKFDAGVDEYFPIPQVQIDLMGASILEQNPGY